MSKVLSTPGVDGLGAGVRALRRWQHEGATTPLPPGDVGWHWRSGAEATAVTIRTWSRDGRILAVGLVDPELARLAIAPEARREGELAREMALDVSRPERGGLSGESGSVEARWDGLFQRLLLGAGWQRDQPEFAPVVPPLAVGPNRHTDVADRSERSLRPRIRDPTRPAAPFDPIVDRCFHVGLP